MRIMISCGEASGDLYAGALAAELRRRAPSAEIFGFGGQRLRQAGAEVVGDFEGLTVTGLTEALRVLPRSYAMLRRLVALARERRPDVFVPIDFPDFNFRLMAALRPLGIPVVYYVSPQLWAWRPTRMATMKALVDRVLVIFPFEETLYQEAGVPVQFVGHPLVDIALSEQPRSAFLRDRGLIPGAPTVALLPGSRPNELRRIAPIIVEALPLIGEKLPDVQFVVACAPSLPDALFAPFLTERRARVVLVHDRTDDALAASDAVVTASGTATVQAALHERPMVVVYRLSPLTYLIGKPFVKVDTYAMTNLVAGRRVVPELIQSDFTPERVAAETVAFLTDRERHARTREALRRVREKLGTRGASGRAAEAILEVARTRRGATSA
ncbi:MAG: lipid-A-disaccharide synthase [Acidimicrobiia bacterium]|nr:lipid-A-disaccharide synthase [Acidimicrobiia bacterium]